jgi:hypothetical protein
VLCLTNSAKKEGWPTLGARGRPTLADIGGVPQNLDISIIQYKQYRQKPKQGDQPTRK